ncbi:MAG: DUF1192 domain-containing protein [Beijerinckiaceae bacterium]|jgi:uncharacterized small protein (DUF1192 family)|nr:DUF1192 domain-containing protein [Beijerinckiaceae bacterium]
MAVFDDDPFTGPKKKTGHEIGEPLDVISVEELEERIALLRSEIERLEEAVSAKQKSKRAAENFFKS